MSFKRFLAACLDPLAVVTLMTALSLIVAVVVSMSSNPALAVFLCLVSSTIGALAIVLQVRRVLHKTTARDRLIPLLLEGRSFTEDMNRAITPDLDRKLRDWCMQVSAS